MCVIGINDDMYDRPIDPPDSEKKKCGNCVYYLCFENDRDYGFCIYGVIEHKSPIYAHECDADDDPCDEYEMI